MVILVKMSNKTICIVIWAILLHCLLAFGVFQYISLQSPEGKLVRSFHQQIKNEHVKVEKLSKAIKKEPNNYNLYLERANAKLKQQEIFNDFVKIFIPYAEYSIINESDILCDLDKAEELNPRIDNDLTIGIIKYKSKDYKFAMTILNDYIKNNPHNSNVYKAYYYRALCYEKLNSNEVAEIIQYNNYSNKYPINLAIQDLKKAISLNPKFAMAYTKLGEIEESKGDTQNLALKYYDKSMFMDKNFIDNYLRKIMYYGFHLETSATKRNLILSEYYNALKTEHGRFCSQLYFSMNMLLSDDNLKLQMPYNEDKATKILARAITSCKYCNIPNEYYEDLQMEYFNIFFGYIYDFALIEDIDSAIYYKNKCEMIALKNHYGNNFCNGIETPIDEKIKKYKLNIKSILRFIQLSLHGNFDINLMKI